MTVDTLGLVLRVLVTAANVGEREGEKQVPETFIYLAMIRIMVRRLA